MLLLAVGCGSGVQGRPAPAVTPATPTAVPVRDPSKDSLPLHAEVHFGATSHIFQSGDDHVTLSIDNHGRDIQDLAIQSGPWLAEHPLAMGSTSSCIPDLGAGLIDCGPIYAGRSTTISLRAEPLHAGTFHYEMRLYDREGGTLVPIAGPDGAPIVIAFDEVVDPLSNQIPGVTAPPSPSAG